MLVSYLRSTKDSFNGKFENEIIGNDLISAFGYVIQISSIHSFLSVGFYLSCTGMLDISCPFRYFNDKIQTRK